MRTFLDRRSGGYTGVGLGLTLMGMAWLPDISPAAAVVLLVVGAVLSFVTALASYREAAPHRRIAADSSRRAPQPNISIVRALDYLVNDSMESLEQNPPPTVQAFGPAKGLTAVWVGKPQQDALRKIEEQLGFGTLTAFGCPARQSGNDPTDFDPVRQIIPRAYWTVGGLHSLFARIPESSHAQTYLRSSVAGLPLYADVQLEADQLRTVFPRKRWWRRQWARVRRQRIGDYMAEPMLTVGAGPAEPSSVDTNTDIASELAALKRLVAATGDEAHFLDLFCTGDILMVPAKQETWLPNGVYRAGERLVASGILTKHARKDGKERFCLPESTERAWHSSGRSEQPVRKCVDIDHRAVYGTGSIGGGSPWGR